MAVADVGARAVTSTVAGAVVFTPAALRREAGVVDGMAGNALRFAPVSVACTVVFEGRTEVSIGGMAGATNTTAESIAKATIPAAMNPRSMSLAPMPVRWR
jgi:hypothetical protein